MIEMVQATKEYRVGAFGKGKLKAVDQVSFTLKPGGICSLIGESGSGKTTIGKMMLRLTDITTGKIMFQGKDISHHSGKALKEYYRYVQGVFQDPFSSFNPIFKADRVFQMVHREFFPHLKGTQWKDKLEASLRSVGLNPPEVLNKFPHQLSGGQLQRFLIARALLLDVKVLIADEIISMLDASTRIDVLNLLGVLKKKGLSVLFITHDLSLGYYISDQALIMYKGSIVEMGSPQKVFFNPVHPYTRNLLNSVPRLDKKWDEVHLPPLEREYENLFIPGKSEGKLVFEEIEPEHHVAFSRPT